MKHFKKQFMIILGCFIMGSSFNLFFKNYELIPAGMFGINILYNKKIGVSLLQIMILSNIFFYILGYLVLPKKMLKRAILPFILIPIFTYLTKNIDALISLEGADLLLIAMFGGALIGLAHDLLYKQDCLISGADIIVEECTLLFGPNGKFVRFFLDLFVVILSNIIFGAGPTLYSIVVIIIIEVCVVRSKIGISESKVFYIITKEEKKVKNFIMKDLGYDLTIYDVIGGFSKNKNKVLMSAIPSKEYYRIREGIKSIDPEAFISITDSYEVVSSKLK